MSESPTASSSRQEIRALLAILTNAVEDAMDEYEDAGIPIPSLTGIVTEEDRNDFSPIALRKIIRVVDGACEQIRSTLAPPAHTMLNRAMAMETYALGISVRHKIADILLDHPKGLHADELSKLVKIESDRLARLLRMLAAKHCFIEVSDCVFANNRLSLSLVSTTSEAAIVSVFANECMRAASNVIHVWDTPEWAQSNDSTKSAFAYTYKDQMQDAKMFDWLKLHPDIAKQYNIGMIGYSNVSGAKASITAYPWQDLPEGTTLCDVGGGVGAFSLPLSLAHPHLKITIQDLEGPLEHAKKIWQEKNLKFLNEGRISFVPFDFFKSPPVRGQDIYYLRFILHMWSDEEALLILNNLRQAMAPHSRIFIHDYILSNACPHPERDEYSEEPENHTLSQDIAPPPLLSNFGAGNARGYLQDFNMMAIFNGKERTISDMQRLSDRAGLRISRVWDLAELGIIELEIE